MKSIEPDFTIPQNPNEYIAQLRQTIATLTQRVQELETELNEQWIDAKGTVWTRPTAWAYAQVCRVKDEQREKIEQLKAELARMKGEEPEP